MDQLNQVAQNMVKILSDWKVENDRYKANVDQFQTGMDVQFATLQNFINSNLAMQSNATKNVEEVSGKRSLPQTSNQNETDAPQSKRMKNNDAESATTCKLTVYFYYNSFFSMLISSHFPFTHFLLLLLFKLNTISVR